MNDKGEAAKMEAPDISDSDIEELMKAFERQNSPDAEGDDQRAEAISQMIGESLEELEEQDKQLEKENKVEKTGIVYAEAAKAAEAVVEEHLKTASQMLEADPSVAVMTLLTPVNEKLRASLDPKGGFSKLHEDPLKQQLYDVFARRLHHEAATAVITALQKRIDSIGERIMNMEASDESRQLGAEERRLLELKGLIEEEDRKGVSAKDEDLPMASAKPQEQPLPQEPAKPEGSGTSKAAQKKWWQVWKK